MINPPAAIWRRNRAPPSRRSRAHCRSAPWQNGWCARRREPAAPIQPSAWTHPSRWQGARLSVEISTTSRTPVDATARHTWCVEPTLLARLCLGCLHQGHMLIRGRMEHKLHGLIRKQVLEQVVIGGTAQHSLNLTSCKSEWSSCSMA